MKSIDKISFYLNNNLNEFTNKNLDIEECKKIVELLIPIIKKELKKSCFPSDNDLLEAVWYMRWNKEKTAMSAVLEPEEAQEIVKEIKKTLNKSWKNKI
jgi:hypothetical protein